MPDPEIIKCISAYCKLTIEYPSLKDVLAGVTLFLENDIHVKNNEKFKVSVRGSAAKDAEKRQRWRLFFGSFEIQTDIIPVGDSLQVTEQFFNETILPCYQKKIYKRDKKKRDFFLLIANLFYASTKRPLILHLNQNYYNKNDELSYFVKDLRWILEENGFIDVKRGNNDRIGGKSFVTRVWPTDKLKTELFDHPALPAGFHVECEGELIVLRKIEKINKTKVREDIPYEPTDYTSQLTEDLQLINNVNRQHRVMVQVAQHASQMLMTDLHAVFAFTFEYGGRFYTRKRYGYQALCRDDRPYITINGNKTVEFDFSGLHPYLLYAAEGIQYEGDPYSVIDNRPALRGVLKLALLTLLNCESEGEMLQVGNHYLYNEQAHLQVMRKYNLTVKGLLNRFKQAHAPIADYFCSGQGRALMNIDSQIARRVLMHFAGKGDACLCVHDSFITEKKNADELKQVMQASYQEVTAELFTDTKTYCCPVKIS